MEELKIRYELLKAELVEGRQTKEHSSLIQLRNEVIRNCDEVVVKKKDPRLPCIHKKDSVVFHSLKVLP